MKKLLLLLIIPFLSFGQLTYIPNDVFEQYLINAGYDDVLDDYVLTSNINTKSALRPGIALAKIFTLFPLAYPLP